MVDALDHAPEHREDEQVDAHQDERVGERPRYAEDRAFVPRPQIPPEQAAEQLAVPDQIDVHVLAMSVGGGPERASRQAALPQPPWSGAPDRRPPRRDRRDQRARE